MKTNQEHVTEKGISVLVVDDDQTLCENIVDSLQILGYTPKCAYDGPQAIAMVGAEKPDYIIMDVRMPGMDGVTAFKKIKQIMPAAKVILMTGYSVDDVIVEAAREGALATLHKPFDIEYLVGLLT